MVFLELKKIKRKRLPFVVAIILIISAAIQYFMGNMTYNGVSYGNELGWFLKNDLTLSSYYIFIPVISLIGMEIFLLEEHNNTMKNLLVIPINKKDILLSKLFVLFIFTILYALVTFLSMCILESISNINNIGIAFIFSYLIKYLIHGMVCYFVSVFIISIMLFFNQNIQITVAVAFIISFIGVFISQVNIAYIYCVNAMFYISGEVNSSGYEKIVASMIVLFIVFLDVILLKKLTEREAV